MPSVTIAGAGTTTTLSYTSSDSAPYANTLALLLTAGLESGSLTQLSYTSGSVAPGEPNGVVFIETIAPTVVAIPTTDVGVVIADGPASITGGAVGITVVGGSFGVTYTDITPSGSAVDYIAVGDGANLISTSNTGTGNYQINTGSGSDTISAFGNAVINAGSGDNQVSVSGGSSLIYSEGDDEITMGGSGTDTVLIGTGQVTINPGTANLVLFETGATAKPVFVAPGTGTDTVSLSGGAGTVFAGTGGNSVLIAAAPAGTDATTELFGAADGDLLFATGSAAAILTAGAGAETLSGAGGTVQGVALAASSADLTFKAGTGNDQILGGSGSDTVVFAGLSADYALSEGPGGTLLVTGIGGGFSAVDTLTGIETLVFADATQAAPCFAEGTHLLTAAGEIPVQDLRPGDVLMTGMGGPPQAIRWIGGRRVDCRRHPDPQSVLPVRVLAHAFGAGCPHRDLILSPDHAVFAEGVLIPVKHLVNGTTVRRMPSQTVTYYHVELAQHEVIWAEGLPCESYLDTGDRAAFAGDPLTDLHPAWGSSARDITLIMDALGAAPFRVEGPEVEAARARLFCQSGVLAQSG